MTVKTYSQKLIERIESVNSNLCVGLDPRVDQIEGDLKSLFLILLMKRLDLLPAISQMLLILRHLVQEVMQ